MFCYDNLEKARVSVGVTKKHLADLLNRSPQIVIDWRNGKSSPSDEQLEVVARALRVTTAYLRGEEDEYGLTPKDWSSMGAGYSAYRENTGMTVDMVAQMTGVPAREIADFEKEGKPLGVAQLMSICGVLRGASIYNVFHGYADNLMGERRRRDFSAPTPTDDTVSFPVIGGVAAGYDHIAYEDWTGDTIDIPRSYLKGRPPQDYFVLKVKGDSMYPDYHDGDHVVVLRQETMDRSGQVGVVIYGDENATLKRIEYVNGEDWMTLRPINPQFPPVTIRDEHLEHCKVLGVAKYVIRTLD